MGWDSATFQEKGTEIPSLSRDKGTTGQAQNLATGWDGIFYSLSRPVPSCRTSCPVEMLVRIPSLLCSDKFIWEFCCAGQKVESLLKNPNIFFSIWRDSVPLVVRIQTSKMYMGKKRWQCWHELTPEKLNVVTLEQQFFSSQCLP